MNWKDILGWIFNIISLIALLLFFRWGGLKALSGIVIGTIIATMLLTTNKGKTALAVIDATTKKGLFK
ncbi:MAG TPA: hypothetical protein VMV86_06300 [Methanosarcinales archaeon]|nr:hypothetical protein [Methanosarcinales archaeon]